MNTMTVSATTRQHSHWGLVTINGALLVLAGLALVAVPFMAVFTFAAAFGLCLVAVGSVGLFAALKSMGNAQHSLLVFLGPFLSIMIGAVLWFTPAQGLMALTEVLGAFTLVTGIFQVVAALGLSPGGTELAQDVGDLQGGSPLHLQAQATYSVSSVSSGLSSGLITLRSRSVATCA